SSVSLRVAAFHFPSRTTPGRLCHRWSGKLMINWTSFSAGPSDSAMRLASSGVLPLINDLRYTLLSYFLKVQNGRWFVWLQKPSKMIPGIPAIVEGGLRRAEPVNSRPAAVGQDDDA